MTGIVKPAKLLLQTTIPYTEDDWHIGRFSLVREYLAGLRFADGSPRYDIVARDRQRGGDDPVLSTLGDSDFDQVWLFAVDVGDGLTEADATGIQAFRRRGGGLLTARDHQDMGLCLLHLGSLAAINYFHSKNPEPDEARRCRDDTFNTNIDFPNYNSGRNGDYQTIETVEPVHEVMRSDHAPDGLIRKFPAHPHEGAVSAGSLPFARPIARGKSVVTGRSFDLAVAVDGEIDADGTPLGRVLCESTFHHFVDYNWDLRKGCPSFLTEAPGDQIAADPGAFEAFKDYVGNIGRWLSSNGQATAR